MQLPSLGPVGKIWWALLAILVAGYLLGNWLNRQRSKAIGEWLQAGLDPLGGQTTWKFLHSVAAGAQVTVSNAAAPFRQLEISYFMLTREFPPLWGIELLRGKRDTLAIRADLRSTPAQQFEVVPIRGKLQETLDQHAGDQPWRWQEMPAGLGLATRDAVDKQLAVRVTAFLDRYGAYIQRLSLRERNPHLVLFIRLTGPENAPARELLGAVRKVVGIPPKSQ